MTFFDKKEDVINIELTPYGRSLLAKGKLLPSYYAFFDDDILYDVMAAGATDPEVQNTIQTRIFDDTPRLKPQRDLQSADDLIFRYERTQENDRPHTQLKLNYMTEPLGTSEQTSDYGPAWKSLFIQGKIIGSVKTVLTGSDVYLRQIPQIDSTIEYTMQVKNEANLPPVSGQSAPVRAPVSAVYPDGTYLDIIEKQILCHLIEKNGFLFKDGLEMSVYLYEDTPETNLLPLKFRPTFGLIKDGILQDDVDNNYVEVDPSYVEYYMNFNFDSEIPNVDICQGLQQLKSQNVELSLDIECPDEEGIDFDIYGTRITDLEKCD